MLVFLAVGLSLAAAMALPAGEEAPPPILIEAASATLHDSAVQQPPCKSCGERPDFIAEACVSEGCNELRRMLYQVEWREGAWLIEDVALLEAVVLGEASIGLDGDERVWLACEALRVARERLRRSVDAGEQSPPDLLHGLADLGLAQPDPRVRFNAVRLAREPPLAPGVAQGARLTIGDLAVELPEYAVRELELAAANAEDREET